MRLQPPDSVRTLQRKLYRKAKSEPTFRFYLLYDKVHRADIRRHAWALVRANDGSPGVDGVSVAAVEAGGVEPFLARLAEELRTHTYRPDPVRRVLIPKRKGGERPLGIPTVVAYCPSFSRCGVVRGCPPRRGADASPAGAPCAGDTRSGSRTRPGW